MEKMVIVKESNKEKINQVFDEVQKRAKTRKSSYNSVTFDIQMLDRHIPLKKKEKEDLTVFVNCEESLPKAYKYRSSYTVYKLVFNKGNWKIDLNSIRREDSSPKQNVNNFHVIYTEEQEKILINNYMCKMKEF